MCTARRKQDEKPFTLCKSQVVICSRHQRFTLRTSKKLMTHVLWRFSRRQEKDAAPAHVRRSASAAHGWEAKQNTQQHPCHRLFPLPTRLQPRPYAHVSVKRAQEASLPLGHFLDAVSINARVPHPPTAPPLWGWAFAPRLPTLSNKTKMLQMEGQRAGRCGGWKPWGPHFDEFLTTQPGLEQMGSVSRALLHGCLFINTPAHPLNQCPISAASCKYERQMMFAAHKPEQLKSEYT